MAANSLQIRVRFERTGTPVLQWHSARLRFAILTDRRGLERYVDSVILLRAASRENAFEQALARGREREQCYRNEEGYRVRWRLAAIVSLDEISESSLDGAEVLSMPAHAGEVDAAAFGWDHEFQPERSVPAETRC